MRRVAVSLALALALGASSPACDGSPSGDAASPTPTPPSSPSASGTPSGTPTQTPAPTPSASPTVEPDLDVPSDAPTAFDGALTVDGPFEELVPPGAEVRGAWLQGSSGDILGLASVVWSRGDDPVARELGFALWERFADGWRATDGFTDPPAKGMLGISLDGGDVTGDDVSDALTFEEIGGSGACGIWRVIAPTHGGADRVLKRRTCDGGISVVDGHLELSQAVFEPGDSHCCPSAYRTTTLEWNGSAFEVTNVSESPAPAP